MLYFRRGRYYPSAILMNELVKWISDIYPQVASTLLTMAVTVCLTLSVSALYNRVKKLETHHDLIPEFQVGMRSIATHEAMLTELLERTKKIDVHEVMLGELLERTKRIDAHEVMLGELLERTKRIEAHGGILFDLLERMRNVETQCALIPALMDRMSRVETSLEKLTWRIDKLEGSIRLLEFSSLKQEEKMIRFEKRIDTLEQTLFLHTGRLTRIEGSLEKLLIYMKNKDPKMDLSAFISKSPLQLSPLGLDILEKTGGKKIIDDNFPELFRLLDSQREKFRSPLDVQHQSIRLMLELSGTEMCIPLRDYIYYNPVYTSANGEKLWLDLFFCSDIMGIYLRNKYSETLSLRIAQLM